MKKSLVALAVLGAFSASAMADVTISGAINVGPMFTKSTDASASSARNADSPIPGSRFDGSKGFSQSNLANNYSNFNISSSDDIGGGNSVVLNIQTAVGLGDTGSTLGNRNSYIGFKGGWGGLYWGTNENIYEQYMYESDPLDGAVGLGGNLSLLGTPGVGRVFEVGQAADGVDFYRRTNDTIWFSSANYGGVSFGAAYTLNAHKSSAADTLTNRVISLGVQYKPDGGPFFVNAAYERHDDLCGVDVIAGTSATDCKDTGLQVGGGVMFGDVSVYARYEMLEYKANAGVSGSDVNKYERDAVWVAAKLNLASGYVAAEIGVAMEGDCTRVNGAACNGADTGATLIGLGYFHNLSKQSQLQFIASAINNDAAAQYAFAGGPANSNGQAGSDQRGLYIGLKHVF
jgi:predicted porin